MERSSRIQRRLLASNLLKEAGAVGLYASIKNEVNTDEIAQWLFREDKEVLFPRMSEDGLSYAAVKSLELLNPGRWGVPEPGEGRKWDLSKIHTVLVPGVAFDEDGYRLGFGGGYFDRTMKTFKGVKIGLAYDFQVLKSLPHHDHDLQCDWIVTETRVIACARRSGGQ